MVGGASVGESAGRIVAGAAGGVGGADGAVLVDRAAAGAGEEIGVGGARVDGQGDGTGGGGGPYAPAVQARGDRHG
ncbi:hypothetical protein FNX48_003785 [Streptomyces sp. IF17]|nr:hypothetical protein [Streptomyces alkaliphilus]